MSEKDLSIVAALQIEDHQLRLLVGQFNNGLLYIVASEIADVYCFDGSRVVDEKLLVETIKKMSESISTKLSTPLTSVVLAISAYRFKRDKKQLDLLLDQKVVRQQDINAIIRQGYQYRVGNDLELINVLCSSYRINGITYPKPPLNESSSVLSAEVDMLCADKNLTYDLVRVVEKSGLKVGDIFLDNYASCYEAALFEQSFNNYLINIYMESSHTVYSLLYNGRIISGFYDNTGYNLLIKPIMSKFGLSYKDSQRLLFRYGVVGVKTALDRVINRWNDNNQVKTISYKDIQQCIYQPSCQIVEDIYNFCSKILSKGNVSVVVTGQGANLQNLQETLSGRLECNVKCYSPDILGAREAKWTVPLGMINLFKENNDRLSQNRSCVDIIDYQSKICSSFQQQETNITSKLKTFTDKLFEEKE